MSAFLREALGPVGGILPVAAMAGLLVGKAPEGGTGPLEEPDFPAPFAGSAADRPWDRPWELRVEEHTLPNGLRLLLLPRPGAPIVSFVLQFRVGSLDDPPGQGGMAHLLEHLFFKGTTSLGTRDYRRERPLLRATDSLALALAALENRFPEREEEARRLRGEIRRLEEEAGRFVVRNELDALLAEAGARGFNALTTADLTTYFVELPSHRAELWFALEGDRLSNPVFREFYAERDVVLEERRMRVESNPVALLQEAHLGEAFRIHPYGRSVLGCPQELERIHRPHVEAFFRSHYSPSNAVAVVVGDIRPEQVVRWARTYLGTIPRRDTPPAPPPWEPPQESERRVEIVLDAEPLVRVGWRIPSPDHPDGPALAVLASLLAGGRNSRLYRSLVLEHRVATGVTASMEPGRRGPGLFVLEIAPRSPHTPAQVEEVLYGEVERLKEAPVPEAELQGIRNQLEAAEVRRLSSNLGLAFQLAESASLLGDWRPGLEYVVRMREVDPEAVRRVVRTYFVPEGRTVATLVRAPSGGHAEPPPAGGESSRSACRLSSTGEPVPLPSSDPGPRIQGGNGRRTVSRLRYPPLRFQPPRLTEQALSTGVPVFFLQDATLPLVTVFARVEGGPSHFPRDLYAAATALPALLRRGGTTGLPPDSLERLLDFYALQTTFGGGGDNTSSTLNTLPRHLPEALSLWGEMLAHPRFDSLEVEVWRDGQRQNLRRRREDPALLAFSEFNRILFGDHPIGWEMDEEDLAPHRFHREALLEVHRRTYCREHLLLGVAGDVRWEEIAPLLEAITKAWPPCEAPLPPPPLPRIHRGGGIFLIPRDLPQSTVVMAHPGGIVQGADQEFFDSRIANAILGAGGLSSRIFSRVRTEKGYAYSASSLWTAPSRHEGIVGAVTQTKPESTVAAIRLILDIMEEMRRRKPETEEVRRAIAQTVNGFVFQFQDPAQTAAREIAHRASGLPPDWLDRYLRGIQRVTPDRVRRVMEKRVRPDEMTILVVGNPGAFDAPLDRLGPVTLWTPGSR